MLNAYQQKLSELNIDQDIENNPEYKKSLDRIELLRIKALDDGLTDKEQQELTALQSWYNKITNEKTRVLLNSIISETPYE